QAIYAMEYEIAKLKIKGADIVITPDVSRIVSLEFHRGKEAIEEGYKKAKEIVLKEKVLQ
ncbi:MAG: patatin family protein, partial [Candidatus Omnitrophica bacterium]|nr:patatin family protein [Candidatus Omnitrophota bacterium]